jgi:hypothetical protein
MNRESIIHGTSETKKNYMKWNKKQVKVIKRDSKEKRKERNKKLDEEEGKREMWFKETIT